MPSFLSSTGAVAKTIQSATKDKDRYGNPTATISQAALRFLGLNIYSIDPEQSREVNVRMMLRSMNDTRDRMVTLMLDQSSSDEDRQWIAERYTQIIQRQADELQKYDEDSDFPASLRIDRK
jgi:hypothetical protein